MYINGHQKGNSYEATGNRIAEAAAKEAASKGEIRLLNVTSDIPKITLIPKFSKKLKSCRKLGHLEMRKGGGLYQMGGKGSADLLRES